MHQLSAQDAQYVYMEDADVVANITGAYICDQSTAPGGVVRFKKIVERIEERLSDSPIFRRKLMRVPMDLDHPYWADDPHFDIMNHVHHARLPKPADWRQFCIHFARYHSRPLNMGRPLWDIYVVEGLDNLEGVPKGSFALLTKVHHSTVDGTSGLQMLGALMDVAPDGPPAFKYPKLRKRPSDPNISDVMRRAAFNNLRSPVTMANALRKASPQIARGLANARQTRKLYKSGNVPDTPFNGRVSPQKAFDATEFAMSDIKLIRKAYPEAKVNDIVLSTVGGGVAKYLKSKSALPKQSLVAMAPINARPKGKSGKAGAGNNITAMTVKLHTGIDHPVERLKAIVLSTRKTKAAKEGVNARLLTDLTKQAPAAMMALSSRFIAQNLAERAPMNNLIVSNVPGPQAPLYFCGAKMLTMYGMAPLGGGMGLFITTPSYNGKISFGVTSTGEIIPDTPFFIECLRKAFDELKAAAETRLKAGATKPAKAKDKPKKKKDKGKHPSMNGADEPARA
jgi:WS/DGAT/MGAT family acyltransferase